MMKKILLIPLLYLSILCASDAVSDLILAPHEKKSLLLDYMFNNGSIKEATSYIKPGGIVRRIEALQELCRLYQPGRPAYTLAKAACRDICHIIQEPHLENSEAKVRLFIRYNVEPVIHSQLYAIQQALASESGQAQIYAQCKESIKTLFNACYLQRSLDIPTIEDDEFDMLYGQKMEQMIKHLESAVLFQRPFEVEDSELTRVLLAQNVSILGDIDHYVAIAIDETREILEAHLKQYDPYCGI